MHEVWLGISAYEFTQQNSERKYNRMRLYDDIVLYYISCQFQQQC